MNIYYVGQDLDFTKIHTKILLTLLRDSYSYFNCSTCCGPCEMIADKISIEKFNLWENKLRAELAIREHVPNKKESRALRIARKKSGISRKKNK